MKLHDRIEQLKEASSDGIKTVHYDGYIFAILMFLSVLGVAIADASERMSHWYWLAMVPVFFGSCLFLEWQTSLESGVPTKTILLKQVQHRLGLLAAVYLTFILREIGSFNNQTTGLVLLLLLALTTFLAGITMGWLFRLLGIFLAFCLIFVVYMEHYLGFIIGVSVFMLILYRFLVSA
ncbi:MAG: hypothetical protein ACXWE4_08970 [Methylobacter sp.]